MTQNKNIKIALVTVSLSGGGAERAAANLSKFFHQKGFEVHHVVFAGSISYAHEGKVLHLETLKDATNSLKSRFNRFLALNKYFKKEQFDYIIDFRVKEHLLQEYIIHQFVYKSFIQTVHSNKIESYIPKNQFFAKILYKNATNFINVSAKINLKVKNRFPQKPTHLIYNPLDFDFIQVQKKETILVQKPYILAVGRMDDNVKQFDHLLECFAKSTLALKNINLLILGEGKLKTKWMQLTKDLDIIENVQFLGSQDNPFPFYHQALFTVMTSKYEGFPMVMLESLACETPVISYNFESGPSEIISHKENGLLVENQNKMSLVEALNEFIANNDLYLHCKKNALQSVQKFSLETIGNQWLKILDRK